MDNLTGTDVNSGQSVVCVANSFFPKKGVDDWYWPLSVRHSIDDYSVSIHAHMLRVTLVCLSR